MPNKPQRFRLLLLVLTGLFTACALARHPDLTPPKPLATGNFSLPGAQQPGPFLSFGQNIIDKNQMQWFLEPAFAKNRQEHFLELTPEVLYGLSDKASLLISLPVALSFRSENMRSFGMSDMSLQAEYVIYEHSSFTEATQATVVTTFSLPTGSSVKNPATGFGAPSLFAGVTFNKTYPNWLWFVSPGVLYITPKDNTHLGTEYFYEMGIGKTFYAESGRRIVAGLFELTGEYTEKNKIAGQLDPDSGGNTFLLTPSLWYSNNHLTLQFGVSVPLNQQLNGVQNKNKYSVTAIAAWLFA